jgi:RimJ/RimL family protein N-acetyltransferase
MITSKLTTLSLEPSSSGPEHLPRYHEWMQDPKILEATGSEPLTMDEEIEMQQSWRDDDGKCTFIVLARELTTLKENDNQIDIAENTGAMIGDVNLFLSEIEDDEEERSDHDGDASRTGANNDKKQKPELQAEIDIMIAEKDFQGKGMGRAATCMMLIYGAKSLDIKRFFCKINEDNESSLKLFKSIGFVQCAYAACFKQIELELR